MLLKSILSLEANISLTIRHVIITSVRKYWAQFKIFPESAEDVFGDFVISRINVSNDEAAVCERYGRHKVFFQ